MFGLKIRSWMETHLVRSKKKRNKDGSKLKQEKSPPDHIAVVNNEFEYKSAKSIDTKKVSPVSTIKTQTTEHSSSSLLKTQSPFTCVVNLSSPESAYSTGYSTDGTSPGASLPPEYYINIRTGTHYFQSNHHKVEKLTPRSARRKKEELKRKKCTDNNFVKHHLPESSTEDEILNASDCQTEERRPTHRRTESCDENNLSSNLIPPPSSPIPPYQCSSPYLPGASPRPRNRIRTNPWLPTSPTGGKLLSNGDTSAIDSSSTVSSSDCREKHGSPQKKVASPRKKPKPLAVDNTNKISPIVNKRSIENVVTTCSPLSSRHCPHVKCAREGSSSSPISSSDDDNHGNTSDFSDDDVTLNEMLGKYDESYTYEKETDILSDSDLTDSEDHDKRGSDFLRRDLREDFDFIDFVQSENNSPMFGKKMNTGHCYYHQLGEKLMKQRSNDSRSSSRGSSVAKRSKKSESEKRKKTRNVSQEKIPPHFKASPPNPKAEKSLNLNKILVERLNQTQSRGTRSANTTPLTARKRLTENGKYLKNDYIINLINSNVSLSEKSRNSYNNLIDRKYSLNSTSSGSLEELQQKKRSNSLCQEISSEPDDLKYKKLTEEANYIIEKLENSKYKSNRKVISAENSPTRSIDLNEPRKFLQTNYSPSRNISSIKLRENVLQSNCADNEHRKYQHYDNTKNCSQLKVNLLKQGHSHFENRTNPNQHFNHVINRIQNINNNMHTMSSSPVKLKMQNATNPDNSDTRIFSSLTHSPLRSKLLRDSKSRTLYNNNNNNLENKIKYSETNGTLEKCRNINDCSQTVNNVGDNRNGKEITEITHRDRNKNIYAIPYEHVQEESNSLPVSYPPVHSNGYWDDEHTSKYLEEPKYENINMTTFSRGTPTNIPYPYPIDSSQSPCKIAINTQTYKLPKPKFSSPMNQRTPLITFQKRLPVTHHTRSIADIRDEETKQKSVLLSFKSLDLGNNSTESYCPRSEPVKRKVYTCSNSYGKLQKSLKGNLPRDTEIYSNQLRNSVAQIRKERFYVEAKLRKTQQQINKIKNESQV